MNGTATSSAVNVTVNAVEPGLLAPSSFLIGGNQYVVALLPDNATYILPAGAIPGVASRPAKPGDVLTLYGIGFGSVTPAIARGSNCYASRISSRSQSSLCSARRRRK